MARRRTRGGCEDGGEVMNGSGGKKGRGGEEYKKGHMLNKTDEARQK